MRSTGMIEKIQAKKNSRLARMLIMSPMRTLAHVNRTAEPVNNNQPTSVNHQSLRVIICLFPPYLFVLRGYG